MIHRKDAKSAKKSTDIVWQILCALRVVAVRIRSIDIVSHAFLEI